MQGFPPFSLLFSRPWGPPLCCVQIPASSSIPRHHFFKLPSFITFICQLFGANILFVSLPRHCSPFSLSLFPFHFSLSLEIWASVFTRVAGV